MAHRSSPAPFLTKTYQLVHDPDTDDVISWSGDGAAFVVWKIAEFAKDVLPKYFKHNNFSSFVRQLNTYGFRKTVPEKWEFFNEHFKRGQKDILSEIRRRKTAHACVPAARRPGSGSSSPSNSGEDLGSGSTSTSSPGDTKSPPGSVGTRSLVPVPDLSEENEKLKRDNESLSTELATAKKQCEELVAFLTGCGKAGPHQLGDSIMCGGPGRTGSDPSAVGGDDEVSDDEYGKEESGERLKLFGVWLKGGKKRGRDLEEKTGCGCRCGFVGGPRKKEMRMELGTRWMQMQLASPPPETSKVCN